MFLTKLLGVNWRTTIAGIGSLVTVVGVIVNAWRTKDFGTIFTQAQTLVPIVIGILTGLGLLAAKDSSVVGAGSQAAVVQSDGTKVNAAGETVGVQPPA